MTAANIITLVRILLIPIFMFFALADFTGSILIALLIFIIASVTDGVDGYIARKYNQISTLGKFLDPLADKLLVTAAILIFVADGTMGSVPAMIILAREFVVTSLRIVAMGEGVVIAARMSGKIKTVMQIIGIVVLLTPIGSIETGLLGISTGDIIVWLMVAITVISGIEYFKGTGKLLRADEKK